MRFLLFLALNMSVPVYLRLKKPSVSLYALAVGFLEDFFIVLELSLLMTLSVPVAALMGCLIHCVLMLDHALFMQMGLRLRLSHLLHLRYARSFYSSAKELGLKKVAGSFCGVIVLHTVGYFTVDRFFDVSVWAVLGIGAATFLLASRLPKHLRYEVDNFFFDLQVFQRKVKREKAVSLTFPLETYQLLNENYPLWRLTKGFQGEKQFEIKTEDKPHVILLFMESFSSHGVSYEKKATPCFDALCKEGIYFPHFYSNGTFTYRALLAGLFGIGGGDTCKGLSPYVNVPYVGLPQLMKQAGYSTAFFHNGSLSFDKQREFLKHHFDLLADQKEIEDSPHTSTSWGAHDECLMRYTVNWLDKQTEPAFTTLFTITNHHPWIPPLHHPAPSFTSTLNLSHERFLQTMHYSDHALGLLIQQLREKKLSQKTILVIVGDHGQPLGHHRGNFYYSRFLYEENVKVPLLIVADGRIDNPKTIEEIGSHVDLLPTLMDMLRLQGVQHGCGTSLMRGCENRIVMFHNPYSEQFLGCRKGNWKWIENQMTQKGELYDLSRDPGEQSNQADNHPEIVNVLRQDTKEYFELIYGLHRDHKLIPSEGGECPPSEVIFDFSTTMITDEELIQFAAAHPQLEKLNLRDCLLISDAGVSGVLSHCPQLEELNLKGVTDITDNGFQTPLARLRTLHISEAAISDAGLEKIIHAYPNISILSLSGKNLTDQGMKALGRSCHLIRLKILQADNLSEKALIEVLKNNPHLVQLVLQGCQHLSDRTLEALQGHPLELLWLFDAPQLTDSGIAHLSKLPIRFITLEGCPLLTDKSKNSLSQLNLEAAYVNCQGLVHL
ncbi:MAG TPA: sulfatase-like hydrolase/transferase [Rhabdochlamydiaceae bacterium]|nr:sulfatase-like hydrolase/transferase [Rhabdochlamydiaceae bacterium]